MNIGLPYFLYQELHQAPYARDGDSQEYQQGGDTYHQEA